MKVSILELLNEVDAFYQRHPGVVNAAEAKHKLPHRLLYAVGSRETNLAEHWEQTPGDGGHGHGTWQLDDRSHKIPSPFPMALQADMAAQLLSDLIAHFKGNVKSAVSAYNAGVGGAERGLRATNNSDQFTTGHDYGQDTLERLRYIQIYRPMKK
jgi:hypothetical protein